MNSPESKQPGCAESGIFLMFTDDDVLCGLTLQITGTALLTIKCRQILVNNYS